MKLKSTRIWKHLKKIRGKHILKKQYLKNKKMSQCDYENYLINRTCEMMQRYEYSKSFAYRIDFNNPQTYTEKMQWLKLYDQDPKKGELTDKYEVREFIKKTIGEHYLVPLISINGKDYFFDANDIDFDKLPNQFALKCTHGSHMNIVIRDKAQLSSADIKRIKKQMNKWLKINYAFWVGLELQYLNIKPRIIIEKYIGSDSSLPVDYKFFCFDGRVEFMSVNENRGNKNYSETYFDTSFKKLPYTFGYYQNNDYIEKPNRLSEMVEIAKKLSVGFKHVRVDLYVVNNSILFGELTFSPGAGFDFPNPVEYDKLLGNLINIDPSIRNRKKDYRKE